jgi:hypothetical protein
MHNKSEIYFTNYPNTMLLATNYCNSTLKSKDFMFTLHNIYYITGKKEGGGVLKNRKPSEKGGGGLTDFYFYLTLSQDFNSKKSRRKFLDVLRWRKLLFRKLEIGLKRLFGKKS